MRINNILVSCFGFVVCKSKFYTSHNTLDGNTFELKNGINVLNGNIDDEGWGISYILSMYNIDSQINLFDALCTLKVNENNIPIVTAADKTTSISNINEMGRFLYTVQDSLISNLLIFIIYSSFSEQ